jgi:hypothetical protein
MFVEEEEREEDLLYGLPYPNRYHHYDITMERKSWHIRFGKTNLLFSY